MDLEQAIQKLNWLGVYANTPEHPDSTRENAIIFQQSSTLDEVKTNLRPLGTCLSAGQFMYFHLGALLKKDEHFKHEFLQGDKGAKQSLGDAGILPEHIEEYYSKGADPALVFSMRHVGPRHQDPKEYPIDVFKAFYPRADQFALDKFREWLGFSSENKNPEIKQ